MIPDAEVSLFELHLSVCPRLCAQLKFKFGKVLTVIVDILRSLDIGNFEIKVNNRKYFFLKIHKKVTRRYSTLLDAMIEIAGCEKRKFKAICSSIDKLDKEPWSKVKQELI